MSWNSGEKKWTGSWPTVDRAQFVTWNPIWSAYPTAGAPGPQVLKPSSSSWAPVRVKMSTERSAM